jgi:hypothetical protein
MILRKNCQEEPFRVVNQKTDQLAENQYAMPTSSNRDKDKTPLSILVAEKEASNNPKNFSLEK